MYNDENNQYNPRPRFDPKTGERIHYDDENTTETTQAESSEYRYSAGNIPFEQENNNTSYYQQSSTFQQDTTYQQAGAGQGSMNQQNGRQKKKKDRNKDGFGERLAKLAGSAAVFGVIAGAVMYGVYYMGSTLLPVKSSSDYNNIATVTSNVTATTAQSTSSASTGMDAQSVANAALPAMVALNGTTTVSSGSSSSFYGLFGSQSYEAQTSGTGIIVGKNDKELLVVTNAHVVSDVNDLKCVFVNGESVSATVKGSKSDKDIAVVAINLSDIKDSTINSIAIAELADSDDVAIGQEVVAIGNALGEGQSVTNGIISATNRSITVNNVTFSGLLMTNAAINSGNSGGALLNAEGKVIAINFAKTSSDGVEGMAYSIPVSNVMDIIDSLMSRETRSKVSSSETAYLGISGVDITSAMSSSYGYPQGVLIRSVENNSAAAQAGLGAYDIIVSFDDQSVNSMSSLKSIMEYYAAGEKVTVQYYHQEGSEYVLKSVEVTLGKKS